MTRRALPWLLWFLMVFFIWSVGRDLQLAITLQRSVDYFIFATRGWQDFFFVLLATMLLVDFAASYSVFVRNRASYRVCMASLVFGLAYNVFSMSIAMDDIDGVRRAYMAERELRGLPASDETARRVFTPEGMTASMLLSMFFGAIGIGALWKARRFFDPPPPPAAQSSGEHGVILRFAYDVRAANGSVDLAPLHRLEDALEQAVSAAQAGEVDGNEVAVDGGDAAIFLFGPDADALYESVRPVLERSDLMKGARVTKRYGAAADAAREVAFTLSS